MHSYITIQRRFNVEINEEYTDTRCHYCNQPKDAIDKMKLPCISEHEKFWGAREKEKQLKDSVRKLNEKDRQTPKWQEDLKKEKQAFNFL